MLAYIIHIDPRDAAEVIAVNGHKIQFGYGRGGDGFCYAHQSFDCVGALSEDERAAVQRAEPARPAGGAQP